MILLKNQYVSNPAEIKDPLLAIEKIEGGYKLLRHNAGQWSPLEIKANDLQPWGLTRYFWSRFGGGFMAAPDYDDSRDTEAFMRFAYGCSEGLIAMVARGPASELAVVTFVPTHTTEPYTFAGWGLPVHAIDSVIPGFSSSPREKAARAKRRLLGRVNIINMLAEQEKQIDLLSMLVLDLTQKQPQSERPDWLPAFKAMLDEHSALQFKGAADALHDVADRKAAMRQLQRAYFAGREGSN